MLWYEALDKKLEDYLPDLKVEKEEPMSRHTSFRIGGPARRMAFPATGEQAVILAGLAEECGARVIVIGNGTNLLAADEGLDALVINTSELCGIRRVDEVTLEADAGVSLARLATFACGEGLSGLEFAHGIPGSLGGAVCMNAGAYDGEMKQVLVSATALYPDGIRTLTAEEMQLSYRHSVFSDSDAIVLSARVRLVRGEEETIREKMRELMERRKKSQPLEYPSAGSTFKRPTGYFAGTLIDQAGLKGFRVGGAEVSEKHAGFVINRGGATCSDVLALMDHVRSVIYEKNGVELEPEVKHIK
ncbi:MAG: UDP-N-acetylmuramate dehydrogenase [Oscillospiraceae bacterium]|nr:UDP-N-acetylmuramate dehydrogenase [Oscillospiraceae bacterium]